MKNSITKEEHNYLDTISDMAILFDIPETGEDLTPFQTVKIMSIKFLLSVGYSIVNTSGIKVMVHIPDKVEEHIKQHKINAIYDILKPKTN
jgi:aromatic ring hydroxylase